MKKISYQYCVKANHGTEENPNYVDTFVDKTLISHTEEEYVQNIQIAQQEAYNGEYSVEAEEDPVAEPNADDLLNALLGVM